MLPEPLARGEGACVERRGRVARLLLPLWWCAGLAIVLLAAAGIATTVHSEEAGASSAGFSLVDAEHWVFGHRDGPRPMDERGALEVETEDEDEQPDTPSIASTLGFLDAPGFSSRARSIGPAVDTGKRLISTGLARGPPIAS